MTKDQKIRDVAANKLSIILGNSRLTQDDPAADIKSKHRAKISERAAQELMDTIDFLLKEHLDPRRHDAHLGSSRD